MRKRMHVFLIGLTGSGKTILGEELAKKLERPFIDIDREIARIKGQSIDAIFATQGEQGFRHIEAKTLKQHCGNEIPSVIATGGGVVLNQQNIRTMRCSGTIIRILRKPESILSTLDVEGRPLLAKNPERIHSMADERASFYRQAADFSVQNEGIPLKTLEEMMKISNSSERHKRIMIINGPNLNRLGTREPEIYGSKTYGALCNELENRAEALSIKLEIRQSNHEGDLVDWIQEAGDTCDGIVINPAAYTHTSITLLDAVKCISIPVIEVHLSNIHSRESFRAHSVTAAGAVGIIAGFGTKSYHLALDAMLNILRESTEPYTSLPATIRK